MLLHHLNHYIHTYNHNCIKLSYFSAIATYVVMKNGIVIASTRIELMGNVTVTDLAVRKKKDTERGGTETKRRDGTSPPAGKWTTETLLR